MVRGWVQYQMFPQNYIDYSMPKQNRLSPKFILLGTSEKQGGKQPLKKRTIPSKGECLFDRTLPSVPSINNHSQGALKEKCRSPSKDVRGIESVRGELGDCMRQIQEQSQKNGVLRELIGQLEVQMQRLGEAEKRVLEVEVEARLKQAQKVEYDIEQILQKHNQEVARINALKEQVASARSDRVVFSNLFRKIEKEIQRNEKIYRSLTIRTESERFRKAQRKLQMQQKTSPLASADEIETKEQPPPLPSNKTDKMATTQQSKLFLTIPHDKTHNNNNPIRKKSQPMPTECSSIRLKYLIEQVETKIEKLARTAQCGSWAEAIEFYSTVEEENSKLMEMVGEEESRIQAAEAELQRLRIERRVSEMYESRQIIKLQNLASTRKIRSVKQIKTSPTEQSQRKDENMDILASIFDLLQLPLDRPLQRLASSEQSMSALWDKLLSFSAGRPQRKVDFSGSYLCGQHEVQTLLSKMQRFQANDRILSREQFCTQYAREVSKNKRGLRRK